MKLAVSPPTQPCWHEALKPSPLPKLPLGPCVVWAPGSIILLLGLALQHVWGSWGIGPLTQVHSGAQGARLLP